jgi:hypothetical protein
MTISKTFVQDLRNQMQAVLDANLKVEGFTISVGNATYRESEIKFKVEITRTNSDGNSAQGELDFQRLSFLFGLKAEWFGKTFIFKENSYKITGLKAARGTRYPVLATRENDGRVFMFAAAVIQLVMKDELPK